MASYEECSFDSNLFGHKVGRIDLEEEDLCGDWLGELKRARDDGMKLVYLISPRYDPSRHKELEQLESTFPGTLADWKTLYSSPLTTWDQGNLTAKCAESDEIKVIRWERADVPDSLVELSLSAGVHSRFKVDEAIPEAVFQGVYGGWIRNSVNKSIADDTFVAVHKETGIEVGLITVKKKGMNLIDIGLLAVSSNQRQKGIATMLLSRAALWAYESIGGTPGAKLQVVTQGTNLVACRAYESFGFTVETTQLVNHVWMPRDLGGALHEAAAAKLDNYGVPFCKQHLTGKEMLYIQEIFDSDLLNSASKYTSLCAMRIKKLLLGGCPRPTSNPNSPARKDKDNMESTNALTAVKSVYHNESGFDCTEVVITASGTSALEMAAILCEVGSGDEVISALLHLLVHS